MTNAPTKIYSGEEPPSVSIDWEEYGHHLEDSDLTDEQKQEFIETLYGIMLSFVDLGIDLRSNVESLPNDSDECAAACGQNSENGIFSLADLVSSTDDHHNNQSTDTAHDAFRQSADKKES